MSSAQQFVSDDIAEERLIALFLGIADDDGLALVDDPSVHQSGIVSGPLAAPAPRLDLQSN